MRALGLLVFLLVTACRSEPDFEERYDEANQEIRAKADAIDAELEQRGEKDGAGNSGKAAAVGPDKSD